MMIEHLSVPESKTLQKKNFTFSRGINLILSSDPQKKQAFKSLLLQRINETESAGGKRPPEYQYTPGSNRQQPAEPVMTDNGGGSAFRTGRRGEWGWHARQWNPLMTIGIVLLLILLIAYRYGAFSNRLLVALGCVVFVILIIVGIVQEYRKHGFDDDAIEAEDKFPVVLDENFSSYSDIQLKQRLEEIEAWHTQVFLFGCHNREIDLIQTLKIRHRVIVLE